MAAGRTLRSGPAGRVRVRVRLEGGGADECGAQRPGGRHAVRVSRMSTNPVTAGAGDRRASGPDD